MNDETDLARQLRLADARDELIPSAISQGLPDQSVSRRLGRWLGYGSGAAIAAGLAAALLFHLSGELERTPAYVQFIKLAQSAPAMALAPLKAEATRLRPKAAKVRHRTHRRKRFASKAVHRTRAFRHSHWGPEQSPASRMPSPSSGLAEGLTSSTAEESPDSMAGNPSDQDSGPAVAAGRDPQSATHGSPNPSDMGAQKTQAEPRRMRRMAGSAQLAPSEKSSDTPTPRDKPVGMPQF
jgi:hypothetical protein